MNCATEEGPDWETIIRIILNELMFENNMVSETEKQRTIREQSSTELKKIKRISQRKKLPAQSTVGLKENPQELT